MRSVSTPGIICLLYMAAVADSSISVGKCSAVHQKLQREHLHFKYYHLALTYEDMAMTMEMVNSDRFTGLLWNLSLLPAVSTFPVTLSICIHPTRSYSFGLLPKIIVDYF